MVHSNALAWNSEAQELSFPPTLNYRQILPSSNAQGAESPHSNLRSIPLLKTETLKKRASRRGASYSPPLYSLSKQPLLVALLQLGSELLLDAAQQPCKELTIAAALSYIVCKSENSCINIIFYHSAYNFVTLGLLPINIVTVVIMKAQIISIFKDKEK